MKLYLYQCLCENNRLDKRSYLTQLFELDGTLREECSLITPVIQVQLIELAKIVKANYAYIPDFGRYYYIDDIIGERTGIITLYMRSDPLMSFREGILDLDVFCSRNEYDYNTKLVDTKLPALPQPDFYFIEPKYNYLDTSVDDLNYCLIVGSSFDKQSVVENKGITHIGDQLFLLTKPALDAIMKQLIDFNASNFLSMYANEPYEAVINLSYFPFDSANNIGTDETSHFVDAAVNGKYQIPFGKSSIQIDKDVTKNIIIARLGKNYNGLDGIVETGYQYVFENNNLHFSDNEFLDYNPYTKYSMFIPFIGFIDMEAGIFKEYSSIRVQYELDLFSSTCDCSIYGGSGVNRKLLKICTAPMGVSIPFTKTDNNSTARNITQNIIKSAGAVLNVGLNYEKQQVREPRKLTPKTQKETKAHERWRKGSELENASSIVNFASTNTVELLESFVQTYRSGSVSGSYASWNNNFIHGSPFIVISKIHTIETNTYAKLLGRPSTYNGKLSGLKGYTEIAGVHIEFNQLNSSPTNEERDEIDSILRSGIILPDPQENTLG